MHVFCGRRYESIGEEVHSTGLEVGVHMAQYIGIISEADSRRCMDIRHAMSRSSQPLFNMRNFEVR
jgi:hypothetical protein